MTKRDWTWNLHTFDNKDMNKKNIVMENAVRT